MRGESLQYRHRSTRCSPFTSSMEKARRYRTSLRAMKMYTLRSQLHYSIVQYSAPIKRPHPTATPSLSLIIMFLLLFIQETGNVFQVGADKIERFVPSKLELYRISLKAGCMYQTHTVSAYAYPLHQVRLEAVRRAFQIET